jgi:hypothetical protein
MEILLVCTAAIPGAGKAATMMNHAYGMPPRPAPLSLCSARALPSRPGTARMPVMTMSRIQSPAGAGLLVFAILGAVLSIRLSQPPAPVPASAPATAFSAERAFRHVEIIARAPHPTGSAANRAVRDYLVAELRALGLEPEVQDAVASSPKSGITGWVSNVVARLPGTRADAAAVLLVAHYDSVPHAPGAGDDAAGVATLLETARVLKASPPLASDVIFLFTDGEEVALLGARAFAREHPWRARVGAVLNFEGRGYTGPGYMFETSADNGWLIQALAGAASHPMANSLMFEVYRRMPNDTDFTVLKEAGLPGLNFGFIGGPTHYHTALDTPAHLDLRSLQHHGSHALALSRALGDQELRRQPPGNRVYFDLVGQILVHYPQAWVWPLTILAGLAYLGVIALAWRRGRISFAGLGAGVLAPAAALVIAAGAVLVLWRGIAATEPVYFAQEFLHDASWYWLGFFCLTVGLVAVWYGRVAEPLLGRLLGIPVERRMTSLALGALLWWLALLVALSVLAPGGTFVFLWPLLASLVWLGLSCVWPPQRPWLQAAGLALAAAPAVLVLMPLIHALHVALPVQQLVVSMALTVLLLGALTPQLDFVTRGARWLVPGLGLGAGVIVLIATTAMAGHDAGRPRGNGVFYLLDADQRQAHWVGLDEPDEWTAQLLRPGTVQAVNLERVLPVVGEPLPASPAPALDLPAPVLEVVEDSPTAVGRRLRLRALSLRQPEIMYLQVRPEAALRAMTVAGQPVPVPPVLEVWNPPPTGIDLVVEIAAGAGPVEAMIEIVVIDLTSGLPAIPDLEIAPRPPGWMPARPDLNDTTLVSKTFRVPAPR